MDDDKVKVMIEMPLRLKQAAEDEARRQMTSLSGLIRDRLKIFLPENIEIAITDRDSR